MNGYTHMVVGGLSSGLLVAGALATKQLSIDINAHTIYPLLTIVPSVIGALGPDIDMPNSTAGKIVRKALFAVIVGTSAILLCLCLSLIAVGMATEVLTAMIISFVASVGLGVFLRLVKHRQHTHTGLLCLILLLPFAWLVVYADVTLINNLIASAWLGFWIGWLSHLVADSFNGKGVPWLYPLKNSKGDYVHYHIMKVTTGTDEERVFRWWVIACSVCAYALILFVGRWLV